MATTHDSETTDTEQDDMLAEYDFDYSKAKANRFAARFQGERKMVVLDPDVAAVFETSEAVNEMLRAIIQNLAKAQGSSIR